MEFKRTSLDSCDAAIDTVVVIDVLRAFTSAAYAFAAGAVSIALVGSVEDALTLKKKIPGSLIMGEVDGKKAEGFDFGNSPASFDNIDLKNRFMIQRTSAGTQGIIRCTRASILLAGSFCCASATAKYIQEKSPQKVTFVVTGNFAQGYGDEDAAFADYLEELLKGNKPQATPFINRVLNSSVGRIFKDPMRPEFPEKDLEYCTKVDCFNFVMHVKRENGLSILEPLTQVIA